MPYIKPQHRKDQINSWFLNVPLTQLCSTCTFFNSWGTSYLPPSLFIMLQEYTIHAPVWMNQCTLTVLCHTCDAVGHYFWHSCDLQRHTQIACLQTYAYTSKHQVRKLGQTESFVRLTLLAPCDPRTVKLWSVCTHKNLYKQR